MGPKDPLLLRNAFDAVEAAKAATTLEGLTEVIAGSLGQMGFTHFLGATATESNAGLNVDILFGHQHQAWEHHYQERGYAQHDAVLHDMLTRGEPLFWSDLAARSQVEGPGALILNEARAFGLNEGFATPIFNLDGSITTVLMMGEHVDTSDPDVRGAAHLLSMYYGSIGRKLKRSRTLRADRPRLTPRQMECLKWARHGKSSRDIGDILGLSPYTVDEHLAGACDRLGVRSRLQAIAEAVLHGLIDL